MDTKAAPRARAGRHPIREWNLFDHMPSRGRVDLAELRKTLRDEPARRTDESRPQAPMDEGDLTCDEPAHQDVVSAANGARQRENLAPTGVRPPATANRLSGDEGGERRRWPSGGFEDHAVLADEGESLAQSHRHVICSPPYAKLRCGNVSSSCFW